MQTHKNYSKKKQKKIQEKASYALHIVIFTYFSLHKFITVLCLELSNSSLRKWWELVSYVYIFCNSRDGVSSLPHYVCP